MSEDHVDKMANDRQKMASARHKIMKS